MQPRALPKTEKAERRKEQLRLGQRVHRERKNLRVEQLISRVTELEATVLRLKCQLNESLIRGICSNCIGPVDMLNVSTLQKALPSPSSSIESITYDDLTVVEGSSLTSTPIRETTEFAFDMTYCQTTIPAQLSDIAPPEYLSLHQRLDYYTLQRTLEYTLTHDVPKLNRLFRYHLKDSSTRYSYTHPGPSDVNRLLYTAFEKGYFSIEWQPTVIPSAEADLSQTGSFMSSYEVEIYLATMMEADPFCSNLRAEEFLINLSRLAICFGWYGPRFTMKDVAECATKGSQ